MSPPRQVVVAGQGLKTGGSDSWSEEQLRRCWGLLGASASVYEYRYAPSGAAPALLIGSKSSSAARIS